MLHRSAEEATMVEDTIALLRTAMRAGCVVKFRLAGRYGLWSIEPHLLIVDESGERLVEGPASPQGRWCSFKISALYDLEITAERFRPSRHYATHYPLRARVLTAIEPGALAAPSAKA